MERAKLNLCKYYNFNSVRKREYGINKTDKMQRYQCQKCMKYFTPNFRFEKTRVQESTITEAMQMYFTGMSV